MDFSTLPFAELRATLPQSLRRKLLAGSVGSAHCLNIARESLQAAKRADASPSERQAVFTLAMEFLLAAWEADHLNGETAAQVLELGRASGWLAMERGKSLEPVLRLSAAAWRKATRSARAVSAEDMGWNIERISRELASDKGNLTLWRELLDLSWRGGLASVALSTLERLWPTGLNQLRPLAESLLAQLSGDHERCRQALQASPMTPLLPMASLRLTTSAKACAGQQYGLRLLASAWRRFPWHTNMTLALHDAARGIVDRQVLPPGRTAVLLYSFNKAVELDATLASLHASKLADATILALDNGSSDDTLQVLARWAQRFGDRFTAVSMRVNIGAPAARNWLFSLPQARESDFVAYLDDDVDLPHDWLAFLGAASEAYPEAGVWGCKVVDHGRPAVVQNCDLSIFQGSSSGNDRLTVSDLQLQAPDQGQFDFLRPCGSVTGCCHLFRTKRLAEVGAFDIRFSPSQFDDLDHDLRLLLAGQTAACQGLLRVAHRKTSGSLAGLNRAAGGNARGNELKLQAKYSPAEAARMLEIQEQVMEQDLAAKEHWLSDNLEP